MTVYTLKNMITAEKVDTRTIYELADAFLSDKGRLIYSAPFRRMQQKAQVFSLESNSAVRSRLSHSLEVAHIGAYVTHAITKKILAQDNHENENEKFWTDNEKSINTIIETTCLMHDIGNPPFGHFGESTISEWFKDENKLTDILKKAELFHEGSLLIDLDKHLNIDDFTSFDGNPQAMRIVTKLQGEDGVTGLNFTYTQIACALKYTHGGKNYNKQEGNHLSHKKGFFFTEEKIIHDTWDKLSMPKNARHPLTFIMEAADDISYCTSDIDDGIEKGVIKESELYSYIKDNIPTDKLAGNVNVQTILDICNGIQRNSKISQFTEFKTTLSRMLVEKASDVFYAEFENIMQFRRTEPLLIENDENIDISLILHKLKQFTKLNIFSASEVEMTELSGYSIITGILDCYSPLLEMNEKTFRDLVANNKNDKVSKVTSRLYRTLPNKYVKSYKSQITLQEYNAFNEWNLRAHLIIDFISGMTDQFALELYQSLTGIKVK